MLATRKSALALRQTEMVAEHLSAALPGHRFELLKLTTTGDAKTKWSLEERGGKGLFTKELEDALLDGRADLAVHSAKDLPTELPEGLALAGFMPRENPVDVLVLREGVDVPAVIATSSPRRRSQAKRFFPNAVWCEIRGNVETRLRKVAGGHCDATILAAAGLNRLGIETFEGVVFKPFKSKVFIPAAGQAAIAIECRAEEVDRWRVYFDANTGLQVSVERAMLDSFGGGCHTAVGVHYSLEDNQLGLFHDRFGLHHFPLKAEDAADPERRAAALSAMREKLTEEAE